MSSPVLVSSLLVACGGSAPAPSDGEAAPQGACSPSTWYADADGDGAGDPATAMQSCEAPSGHVAAGEDCDDTDPGVGPDAVEVYCDGTVQHCGGSDGDVSVATGTDLQTGIDLAAPGQVVCVEPGSYYGPIVIDAAVTLASTAGAAETTIYGDGRERVVTITGAPNTKVVGMTVTDGAGQDGGGIYVFQSNSVVLEDLVVEGNSGPWGGGITLDDSSGVRISGCTLRGNSADYGGGLAILETALDALVEGNLFEENDAGADGGGAVIFQSSRATLRDNDVFDNFAWGYGGGFEVWTASESVVSGNVLRGNSAQFGGGMDLYDNVDVVVEENTIEDNDAQHGGGISLWYAHATTVRDNDIVSNHADLTGGGLMIALSDGAVVERLQVSGNVADAWGGGVYVVGSSDATLAACTMEGNSAEYGGGLLVNPTADGDVFSADPDAAVPTRITLVDNGFAANTAWVSGGGAYLFYGEGDVIEDNAFEHNIAGFGAGLFWDQPDGSSMSGNTLEDNVAENLGGGMYLYLTLGDQELVGETYRDNIAADGGGLYCDLADYTEVGVTWTGNAPNATSGCE